MEEPMIIPVPWSKFLPTKATVARYGLVMKDQCEYPIRWDENGEKITAPAVVNL